MTRVRPRKIVPLTPARALTAAPKLAYHGGPVLGSVEVVLAFWGADWSSGDAQLMAQLDGYFDYILTSSFMATLQEYSTPSTSIRSGRRIASVVAAAGEPNAQVTDDQIQKALQQWIAGGTVPQPDANTVYFVYLRPGITVSFQGGLSCKAFCGYHENIGNSIFYAVEPYITCAGCSFGAILDSLTTVSSHELAEAITDPDGNGWYDDGSGDEVGDICAGSTTRLGDYLVQNLWSNARGICTLG